MGNLMASARALAAQVVSRHKKTKALPINSMFKLPSPLPTWPPGEGFASGSIDLGGLTVCQIATFNKVWATLEGGPDNLGATFFDPSPIPQGFFMLGSYAQPNNKQLFGSVLAAKDIGNGESLQKPIDYTLVWSSQSLKIKQDGIGYIWSPTPPDGYKAVGLVITNSPEKPSLDKIRCVRSDFTDECQTDKWLWGEGSEFKVYSLRPTNIGVQAMGVSTGTFSGESTHVNCLKNVKAKLSCCMPNKNQIEALMEAYSPLIYFHPDEVFLPSSVAWFFTNGALLYKKGQESTPEAISPSGSNLPQGGSNDGEYWMDLPSNDKDKERVKKGDLESVEFYLHIKPMLGASFTDIQIWIFYPFNGPARAKIEFLNVSLGKIGEHVGDWEHLTLRVSNFSGELTDVYFSQHSGGVWVSASELEFESGNKPVTFASLHGHAMYAKPGLVLQGSGEIGIRNDTSKSKIVKQTGNNFEYLGYDHDEPPWLNYCREWGPKISYDIGDEIKKVEKVLPWKLKTAFAKFVKSIPNEILGEEGPTGPKMKRCWNGDEV